MNKNYRQSQIVKLIRRAESIHTQDELARALARAQDSGDAGHAFARYPGAGVW